MALVAANDALVRSFMEDFNLSYEIAKEVLCADLASDRPELEIYYIIKLKEQGYSVCDVLTQEEKEIYVKLIRGEIVETSSIIF